MTGHFKTFRDYNQTPFWLVSRYFLYSSFFEIYEPCWSFTIAVLHKVKNPMLYLKWLWEMTQTSC